MRRPEVSPWASLVFEVMSHQTPIPRVRPIWEQWMQRWPTPADLADASPSQVLVAWDRLGYPSRALRLRECAEAIRRRPGGEVPADIDELLTLPGIGPYTASALAAFQFEQRVPVLDTNVRRVLHRVFLGERSAPSGQPSTGEVAHATRLLPEDRRESSQWNLHLMEFGALVCTQRRPACNRCPLRARCRWARAGFPGQVAPLRTQAWAGTDRQARGKVMAVLRARHATEGTAGLSRTEALEAATLPGADPAQAQRVLEALDADGLVRVDPGTGAVTFP
ncbi:A/G-specific adenine glycosylase [Schaalia sp. 19OD2882]|nr:A/G-specific adenine glycosylase [Schaalia sp. 19OD2882]QWW20565.1 A/G-specific adenine glycosylase [Schaalia sp. 19OD2882]